MRPARSTTGGFGGCMFCAGAHQSALQAAGCLPPQIAAFCSANNQCTLPYKNVTDAWRNISHLAKGPGGWMGDVKLGYRECGTDIEPTQATGVGGGGWYRFGGAGGDALPLQPPARRGGDKWRAACGTYDQGWLSGCRAVSPDDDYINDDDPTCRTPGRYPTAAEGVAEMTGCFDDSADNKPGSTCAYHAAVGVVMCDGFMLWRLPYAPYCDSAYCTTASGL